MARNKDLPSKLRRGKKAKQAQSIPNWIIMKSGGKVRTNPHSRRYWRNHRLKRD